MYHFVELFFFYVFFQQL
ncbi:unnamed protein product [Staurois parvus]|uniref:Uncharacterized protein n=1 Tax=Staurois parvus TaxID=386267 RepID=A0ABN9AIB7_9NEOB|nr:unnamed protein product [Staurois parvus]